MLVLLQHFSRLKQPGHSVGEEKVSRRDAETAEQRVLICLQNPKYLLLEYRPVHESALRLERLCVIIFPQPLAADH